MRTAFHGVLEECTTAGGPVPTWAVVMQVAAVGSATERAWVIRSTPVTTTTAKKATPVEVVEEEEEDLEQG